MTINNKGDQVDKDFKSNFLSSAEEMKDILGPALCLAKWKQVSLHLPTGLNNSCYHPPLHPIPADLLTDNPSALHNTPYKKEQRKIMLRNERPSECSYCWTMEDNGKLSDRHYRSGKPAYQSSDHPDRCGRRFFISYGNQTCPAMSPPVIVVSRSTSRTGMNFHSTSSVSANERPCQMRAVREAGASAVAGVESSGLIVLADS